VTNLLYFVSYGGTSLEGPVKGDYYGASIFRITGGEGMMLVSCSLINSEVNTKVLLE
jgi:hypothetical protein